MPLWPADDVALENTDFVPGADLHPRGYAVIATMVCGDAFRLDLNEGERSGDIPVVLMSHELAWGDLSADEIRSLRKIAAPSLDDWLELFAEGRLDIGPLLEPPERPANKPPQPTSGAARLRTVGESVSAAHG